MKKLKPFKNAVKWSGNANNLGRLHELYKANDMGSFINLYDSINDKDISIYNLMMKMYKNNGGYKDGINVYSNIDDGLKNIVTHSIGIELYSKLKDMEACQDIFDGIRDKNSNVFNIMMNAYYNNGMYSNAIELFLSDNMKYLKDNISCNVAIKAYSKTKNMEKAQIVFNNIHNKDTYSYNAIMQGYNDNKMYQETIEIFMSNSDRISKNNIACNIVIQAYSKLNQIENCERIFNSISDTNIYIYNSMMQSYYDNHMYHKSIELFNSNELQHLKDNVSNIIGIQGYSKLNDINNCENIFESVKDKDVIVFNCMMQAYLDNKLYHKVIELYSSPYMKRFKDDISCNIAIQGYSKLNDIPNCEKIFYSLDKRNAILCGSMMQAYMDNKMYKKIILIFNSNGMSHNIFLIRHQY